MDEAAKPEKAVDLWRAIVQTKEIVEVFKGLFDVMAITIEETGEELTVRMGEDRVNIDPGLPDEYDFLVPIKLENVHNMVVHAADGRLDAFEIWRIIRVLFTPLTRETMRNPMMAKTLLRKLVGIEDLIHVQLLGPEAEQVGQHTLAFAGGQWLVLEGLHGLAGRTFAMTGEDCITYQKQVFRAIKAETFMGWLSFARWYVKWRPGVSSLPRDS